jgi:hypothetical protein
MDVDGRPWFHLCRILQLHRETGLSLGDGTLLGTTPPPQTVRRARIQRGSIVVSHPLQLAQLIPLEGCHAHLACPQRGLPVGTWLAKMNLDPLCSIRDAFDRVRA